MQITRTSPFSGNVHTMEIPVSQEQMDEWEGGALIQNAMPNLSAGHREFIKTGITDEEWDAAFGFLPPDKRNKIIDILTKISILSSESKKDSTK